MKIDFSFQEDTKIDLKTLGKLNLSKETRFLYSITLYKITLEGNHEKK